VRTHPFYGILVANNVEDENMVERTSLSTQTMTASDYLALPETTQPMELIDGEVIMALAPSDLHQQLITQFVIAINAAQQNGSLRVAPIDVQLDKKTVVQPDVMWVGPDTSCKLIDGKYWAGPPDLVIEIFSPGSVRRDKTTKFDLYEKHGVKEYWMVDPHEAYIEVWVLTNDQFVHQGVYGRDDEFSSTVLGGATLNGKAIFA
jgi:Uma2 family endonuclease